MSTPMGLGIAAFFLADIVLAIVALVTIRKVFSRRPVNATPGVTTG